MKSILSKNLTKANVDRHNTAGYLGIRKFHSLLIASMIDAAQLIAIGIIDKLITGNIVGPDAVAAISLLSPVDTILMLFELLFSTGASVLYARAIADYDGDRARKIEGMTIIMTIAVSIILLFLSYIGENAFFDMIEATGEIREYAANYFFFSRFMFILTPISTLLGEFAVVDGDEKLVLATTLFDVIGDIGLSVILCFKIGIAGASLGSIIGSSFSVVVLFIHFFKKSNPMRPVPYFSFRDTCEILKISAADSVSLLFDTGFELFIKFWFISHYGMVLTPVLATVTSILDLLFIADSISSSCDTMIIAYRGDGNPYAIRNLLHHATKIAMLIGLGFIAVICIIAPVFPYIYGIRDAEMIRLSAIGCRIVAVEIIPYSLIALFNSYYVRTERYGIAISLNAADSLLLRAPLIMIFSSAFGMTGVWIGCALTGYASLFFLFLVISMKYGRSNFPLIDIDRKTASLKLSFMITPENSVNASIKVSEYMKEHGIDTIAATKAALIYEEVPLLVADINKEINTKKEIHIDTFAALEKEGVKIVFWYDGELANVSDPDMLPKDLRNYLITGLFNINQNVRSLTTSGYNRLSFVIPYSRQNEAI